MVLRDQAADATEITVGSRGLAPRGATPQALPPCGGRHTRR
ncbi:hypothetical protein [Streptosporangium longisporum]